MHIVPSNEIDQLLEEAKSKDQPVIIGGGDGSVRAAAQKLAGTQVPLGVIPLGTMNLFAREIEMPLDFDAALEAIATGEEMRVDAASVNGDIFLCNSLMGLPAIFSRHRETLREPGYSMARARPGHWPAVSPRCATASAWNSTTAPASKPCASWRWRCPTIPTMARAGWESGGPRLDGGELGVYTSRHRTGFSAALSLRGPTLEPGVTTPM